MFLRPALRRVLRRAPWDRKQAETSGSAGPCGPSDERPQRVPVVALDAAATLLPVWKELELRDRGRFLFRLGAAT